MLTTSYPTAEETRIPCKGSWRATRIAKLSESPRLAVSRAAPVELLRGGDIAGDFARELLAKATRRDATSRSLLGEISIFLPCALYNSRSSREMI